MAFFTAIEAFDAVVMSLVVGYILMGFFQFKQVNQNGVPIIPKFSLSPFWMAVAVAAPAIVLHEMGHKFIALGFGLDATFSAYYIGLAIGVILRLIKSPVIFFVPAFVAISQGAPPIQNALIALSGPAVNAILWITSKLILKYKTNLTPTQKIILLLTRKINGFLFIINMIPIPGFDGFHFFKGIYTALF